MLLESFDINAFDTFYPLLKTSFPEDELLPLDLHKTLFSQPTFFGRHYDNFSAFVIGYQLQDYLFLELFMVQEHLRNQGIGQAFLQEVIKEATTPIILEVELPENELSKRRINFYERLGFHLNLCDYKMPVFDKHHGGVPLYLMSYPNKLTEAEINEYSHKIYKDVYLVKMDPVNRTL